MRATNAIASAGVLAAAALAAGGPPTADKSLASTAVRPAPASPPSVSPEACAQDDFNRPDGPIGGEWWGVKGPFFEWRVENNKGKYTSPSNSYVEHGAVSAAYSLIDLWIDAEAPGPGDGYVALASGLGGTENLYIKVQQSNGSGMFHQCGFYRGFNGLGWAGMTGGPAFFDLSEPFVTARLRLTITNGGDTATLEIDTDFNGTPDQSYSRGGVLGIAPSFGMKVGIGAWGSCRFDNWGTCPPLLPCYADCNGDQILNIADFGCFQTNYAINNLYADCNNDMLFNLADFGCFQTKFALGCP